MRSSAATVEPVRGAQRFRIEGEIARGGMGVVYRAFDELSERQVALKRPLPDAGAREVQAFAREYRTLVSLKHPRIIEVFDYGVDALGPYYSMELLDGTDLRARCPLPWREACAMIRDVASSLALLHARSMIHRDVSPLNIRLTADRHAKLLDFGALAPFGRSDHVVGTPSCIAPEVLDAALLDQRVDVYALGAVAYFALTGRFAYDARALAALPALWARGAPPPPSQLTSDVPAGLDELVLSMLAIDPLARPSHAAEVIDRVNAIAELSDVEDAGVIYSYFKHPVLVGRGEFRERTTAALARLRAGRGRALLIEAASGFGKTAALGELTREARLDGALVLSVQARAHTGLLGTCDALLLRAELELGRRIERPQGFTSLRRSQGSLFAEHDSATEVADLFQSLAAERPLVIAVDDLEHADLASIDVLSRLAKNAANHRLLLVGTADAEAQVQLRPLRRHALRVLLRRLAEQEIAQLVGSIFGDVPGAKRVSAWLATHTQGSPSLIMEGLSELVEARAIRYADGAWVLPQELPASSQASVGTLLARRLSRLSVAARALARCLSVQPRAIERAFASRVAEGVLQLSEPEAEAALAELMREGTLVGDGGHYAFAHEQLRGALYAELTPQHRVAAHTVLAQRLVAGTPDQGQRLEAARHFAEAGDAAAADRYALNVEISRYLDQLMRAVPDLLGLYAHTELGGGDPYAELRFSFPLLIAGLYMDPTLHDRLGARTVDLLERRSGMALAKKLGPYLGATLSVITGLLVAYLWYLLTPKGRRWSAFSYPLAYFGACASLSNQATLRLDPVGQRAVVRRLEAVKGLPKTSAARLVYDALASAGMYLEGRHPLLGSGIVELPKQLELVRDMDEGSRVQYKNVLHFWSGRYDLVRMSGTVLEHAEALTHSNVSTDWINAAFLRSAYHLSRGDLQEAELAREALDQLTARHGQNWMADVMLALEFPSYHLACDVVGLKRCVQQLEGLVKVHPTLELALEVARAMHEGHLGKPESALARYAALGARIAAFSSPFWSHAQAHAAECENELGQHEAALVRVRAALAVVGPAKDHFVAIYQQLEREEAAALSGLGRHTEAAQLLDGLLARHGQADQPLLVGMLHRDRARVAAQAEDAVAYVEHLAAARVRFASTKNPALRMQSARLAELGQQSAVGSLLDPAAAEQLSEAMELRALLATTSTRVGPAQRLLDHAVSLSGAERARLYTVADGAPRLAAQHGADAWPPGLGDELCELVESLERDEGMTTVVTESTESPWLSGSAHRLHPLIALDADRVAVAGVLVVADAPRAGELTPVRLDAYARVLLDLANVRTHA